MAWVKAPQNLIELFQDSLPRAPEIEPRKMFGYPAAFVNGNMFAGVFQDQVFVRLAPSRRQAVESAYGALPFEPMPGRPMKDYMRVPDALIADEAELADLLAGALVFAGALPPKEKEAKKGR